MKLKDLNLTSAITFRAVSKKYPIAGVLAVTDLSLDIYSGEFFCLVGPSGCGKSTVLKLIAGLEKPTSGTVEKPKNIAMVFQSGALLPWLTVTQNVAFGLKMKGGTTRGVSQYLEMVGLTPLAHRFPRELSGGQRQRVGIARALAVSPEVLLLDEPFSALDAVTTDELHKDLLKIWRDTKITVVMVSHLLEEAALLADRVAVMENGRLKEIVETKGNREEALSKLHRLI